MAALAVCLTHAAYWTGGYTDDYAGRLASRWEVGVAIFFVLSGYLLFAPWVQALRESAPDRRGHPSTLRYARHRVRRVLPAYAITVAAVYAIFLFRIDPSDSGQGWPGFLRNLTFTQVYGMGHLHTGLTQMWSMAAEVAYYVALPLVGWVLARLVCRDRWRPDLMIVCLAGLALLSPIWTIAVHGAGGIDPTARLWPPAFASWFIGGMLLAVLAHMIGRWPALPSVMIAVIAFVVSGAAAFGEPTIVPTEAAAAIGKHAVYLVIAVGLVGPLAVGQPRPDDGRESLWSRFCAARPTVWFGEISYEFFLVHVMVLEFVMDLLGYPVFTGSVAAAFATTTAISVPIAWGLHRVTAPVLRSPRPSPVRRDSPPSPAPTRG